MEIFVLLIVWAISIPICVNAAKKIGANKFVAGLAGFAMPFFAPIAYTYVASHLKDGRIQTDKIWKDVLITFGVIILIYIILNPLFN